MENKITSKCYCCNKIKEGTYIEYSETEKRFCCKDCNHLNTEKVETNEESN